MRLKSYLNEASIKNLEKELKQWNKKMEEIAKFFKAAQKQKIGEINQELVAQDHLGMAENIVKGIIDQIDDVLERDLKESIIYEYKKVESDHVDKHLNTMKEFAKWVRKNKKTLKGGFEGKMLIDIIDSVDFRDYILDLLNDMKKVMKKS